MQRLRKLHLDCDAGVAILMAGQVGGIACHTDRESCLYRVFKNDAWKTVDPVLKDPDAIYEHAGHRHD